MNDNNSPSPLPRNKRKRTRQDALGDQGAGKPQGAPRIVVLFVSFRQRELDYDNLVRGCKGLLDGLRYSGLIPNDRPKDIEAHYEQIVSSKIPPKTLVQIKYS